MEPAGPTLAALATAVVAAVLAAVVALPVVLLLIVVMLTILPMLLALGLLLLLLLLFVLLMVLLLGREAGAFLARGRGGPTITRALTDFGGGAVAGINVFNLSYVYQNFILKVSD